MREKLKERDGRRGKFTATVGRFSLCRSFGYTKKTVLMQDVKDEAGTVVTDHLWFKVGKRIADLDLKEGEQVSFSARVSSYTKGYRGSRDDYEDRPPVSTDYCLKFPTDVKRVGISTAEVPPSLDSEIRSPEGQDETIRMEDSKSQCPTQASLFAEAR